MKTLTLVIFLFLFCQNSFCQEKILSIESLVSNKEITIKENRIIKVVTKTGEKFAGRLLVLDQNTIVVDGVILDLNEIDLIRKHSLLKTILIKTNFFHMGTVIFLASLLIGSFSGLVVIPLIGGVNLAGGIYCGVKLPNNSKSYKPGTNWTFKIKGLPESNAVSKLGPIRQ